MPEKTPLPRSAVALKALEACTGLAPPVPALDGAVVQFIQASMKALVEGTLVVLRDEPDNPAIQEAGARFIAGAARKSAEMRALLQASGAPQLMAHAIQRHPTAKGVQDEGQWAIAQLAGPAALADILRGPELASSPEVGRAALWAASCLSADAAVAAPWAVRLELANAAEAAIARYPGDSKVASCAVCVIGLMLKARAPDADHASTGGALRCTIEVLQAYQANRPLVVKALRALANLVEGNLVAAAEIRQHREKVIELLDGTLERHHGKEVATPISRLYYATFGTAGLLEALGRDAWQGPQKLAALLTGIGRHAEECDAEVLLGLDPVRRITASMGSYPAVGVAALGKVVEFLLQYAASPGRSADVLLGGRVQSAITAGVGAVVERLRLEICSETPDVQVYAEGLAALRNFSRRSDEWACKIREFAVLPDVVNLNLVIERDYFRLSLETLWQLVGAVLFFAGLPKVQMLLEKYPEAPMLHQAAFGVFVEAAEHEDGANGPGTILGSAPSLAFYATKVLSSTAPGTHNAEPLAAETAKLLGHLLPAVPPGTWLPFQRDRQERHRLEGEPLGNDPPGPVFEDAIRSLVGALVSFSHDPAVASEVCCALVRAAPETTLPILAECRAGDVLLAVAAQFPGNADVLVALGALGGYSCVVDHLKAHAASPAAQLAGCRAIAELGRGGRGPTELEDREAAVRAVHAAVTLHAGAEHWQLHTQAQLALGFLSETPRPTGRRSFATV